MIAFRQKMATPEAEKQYRRRSRVIEFCHAWIKSKLGLRQFHLRGLAKVQMENALGLSDLQPAAVDPPAQNCKPQPPKPAAATRAIEKFSKPTTLPVSANRLTNLVLLQRS